ncbi:MAG: SAM-dependent methyltransferase [Alphaproteobacteria bacterium]
MTPIGTILRQRIEQNGPITVAEYMATVLQHPEHGYYRKSEPIGATGDFITAPEISQMFGEMIGLWCIETWQRLGRPGPFALVELGPGRGTLMADILRTAKVAPAFAAAMRLHLVESNAALRTAQRLALSGAEPTWHDDLGTVPALPMIVIANEFFDALAIHQIEQTAKGLCERRVTYDPAQARFAFVAGPVDPKARAALVDDPRRDLSAGAVIEVCPDGLAICRQIARCIGKNGGAALIIDYGPAISAAGDSLQAVRHHRPHPVLDAPGKADLTAHVDFAALARAATAEGAAAHGPVEQGLWLRRLGIELRAKRLMARATPAQAAGIRKALARLVAPNAMGALFKVLALAPRGIPGLAGFEMEAAPC